jgi:hypothetical protein
MFPGGFQAVHRPYEVKRGAIGEKWLLLLRALPGVFSVKDRGRAESSARVPEYIRSNRRLMGQQGSVRSDNPNWMEGGAVGKL